MTEGAVLEWLLDGDPAVAWQAQRGLLDVEEATWSATRRRVSTEGWGRQLLDLQDTNGRWARGLYQPKWTSTNYTLLELRRFGLDPANQAAKKGVQVLLDDAVWVDGGVSYWAGQDLAERCVNGMVLSLASYFEVDDDRVDGMAKGLIDARLRDGAWNCRDYLGDNRHSSFHTTISILEALVLWGRWRATGAADEVLASAHEFMFSHHLFRSHTTGDVINEAWTRFSFPPRWHYDILRGLDHLRDADVRDARMSEAMELVRERRRADGRWSIGPAYSGERHFRMETGRQGGRWNTLRALRVLDWWDAP
ncbi:MAG: hypothetical protein U9N56_02975 [Actinomycetota bacterium]|nr:hypothetical protein [Actinomycetota bacterium]